MSAYTNIRIFFAVLAWPLEPKKYVNKIQRTFITRYEGKTVTVPIDFESDGATYAPNIGFGWLFHDHMFKYGKFDDGTPLKWRQANRIMVDVMEAEGWPRWVRRFYRRGIRSKHSLKAWKAHRRNDDTSRTHNRERAEGDASAVQSG